MSGVSCSQSISQEQLLLTACIPAASPHPHSAAPPPASLCLQQPTIHGGSCGMSLADKLYGKLSSWLALSLGVQCSCFRWILAHQATLQREAQRVFLVGFASGGSSRFEEPLFCTTTQGLVCGGFHGGWVHSLPLEVHFQPFPTAFGTGIKLISLCSIFPVPC